MSASQDREDEGQLVATSAAIPLEPSLDSVAPPKPEDDRRLSPTQRALFEELSRVFIRRSEERSLRRLSSEQLRRSLIELLGFIAERKPGQIKVRAVAVYDAGLDPNEDLVALEACMDDQPFIVDTIRLAFSDLGHPIAHAVTLLVPVRRDADGTLVSLRPEESLGHESITRFLILRATEPEERDKLVANIQARLELARAAALAFLRLKKLGRELMNEYDYFAQVMPTHREAFEEASAFLGWLIDDHFVFFGASMYEPKLRTDGTLGAEIFQPGDLAASHAERFFGTAHSARDTLMPSDLVRVEKSEADSKVHRAGKIVNILVRRFDDAGRVCGGAVFHGLLTQKASSSGGSTVPIVRRRLEGILRDEEAIPESHHYRAINKAFDALPIEFLLEAPLAGLKDLVLAAVRASSSRDAVVHVALNTELRSLFAIVIVSQDVFTDGLREALQGELTASTQAVYSDYRVSVGFARAIGLYFYLSGCDLVNVVPDDLASRLQALCTPWLEQFERALRTTKDPDSAQRLSQLFDDALPEDYQRLTSPERAVRDVELFDEVLQTGQMRFDLFQDGQDIAARQVRLRLYHKDEIFLSDILPILDHFGFRVIDQDGLNFALKSGTKMSMDTFRIAAEDHAESLLERKEWLIQGLRAVFQGNFHSDPLNGLMVRAALRWEEVDLLRAHLGYLLQIRPTLMRDVAHRVLAQRVEVTRALVDYFHARFSPTMTSAALDKAGSGAIAADDKGRIARVETARERLHDRLRVIHDATEDRILRAFVNIIDGTCRTNFYRRDKKSHYISFKIDCSKLEIVPEPRPRYEIFVHAANIEGVHLRGGKIARGGIRWSDRLDDYRAEIFGLMQTQMVKNVLIVPVGAKGGFILKSVKPGEDRRAFADQMYEIFIRGLLDVTDNIVDNRSVSPPNVICYDDDDPYLVVAADKGTAHLSDTANRLSNEYGFWLGDAFASGGSAGYDHKVYAITARGAWACARHHFSFLGIDPERDQIRVVGIGDMSGDVFGNGMLLSRTMRLVGAFDHRHVFLDPDPDPEISFLERQRLFRLPRSSWGDYRKEAFSHGGGAFSRTEKAIALSPECRALLGVTDTTLPPETVIRCLLSLDVDMIWNGGIGTYIKSSDEDHVAVGDRVNDSLRVDAKDVRAKVFVEGGNLGVSRRGRVEYARLGGRINTDAIDNSAGVDLSDHEVNLKILFAPLLKPAVSSDSLNLKSLFVPPMAQFERAVRTADRGGNRTKPPFVPPILGSLSLNERNELLHKVAEEVCLKVIENNTANAMLLTLDQMRSKRDPYAFIQAIRFLEERGAGIPAHELIPTARQQRERGFQYGLFRPEHAKISAYLRTYITGELLKGDPLRFPDNESLLADYFPEDVYKSYHDSIEKHLLLRELLATLRTNTIVKFAGSTFFPDLVIETDRSVADVALAYTIAVQCLGATPLRAQILNPDDDVAPSMEARYSAIIAVEDALRESASWLLHFLPEQLIWTRAALLGRTPRVAKPSQTRTKEAIALQYGNALSALREQLSQNAPNAWRRVEQDAAKLHDLGLPDSMAQEVGISNQWPKIFPIVELSDHTGAPISDVTNVYLTLGQRTRLNALIFRIGRQPAADLWEALALRGLRATLLRILFEFAEQVLVARANPEQVLERFPAFGAAAQEIFRTLPNPDSPVGVAALVVVADRLRKALHRVRFDANPFE